MQTFAYFCKQLQTIANICKLLQTNANGKGAML
nr:MAG TPA: hypothetical protein [Caudoviricetes sp.]